MPMMTLQILKSMDFIETQKSRHLENKTFFFQIKKFTIVFPLITARPQISTTPLGIHIEISASL